MSSENPAETPAVQAVEAARIRRRWLTLGEILAVVAVVISALTFWNSYSERRNSEAERAAASAASDRSAATILFRATIADDGRALALAPIGDKTVERQSFAFPPALGIAEAETMADGRIEARWFADAVKKARKAAGRDDESKGIERLPVLVTTRFAVGSALHSDSAIYEIGYVIQGGGLLGGDSVRLRGLTRVGAAGKDAEARLDTLWKARLAKN